MLQPNCFFSRQAPFSSFLFFRYPIIHTLIPSIRFYLAYNFWSLLCMQPPVNKAKKACWVIQMQEQIPPRMTRTRGKLPWWKSRNPGDSWHQWTSCRLKALGSQSLTQKTCHKGLTPDNVIKMPGSRVDSPLSCRARSQSTCPPDVSPLSSSDRNDRSMRRQFSSDEAAGLQPVF